MYILKKVSATMSRIVDYHNIQLVVFALTLALFILCAGAPNAGIGIGK